MYSLFFSNSKRWRNPAAVVNSGAAAGGGTTNMFPVPNAQPSGDIKGTPSWMVSWKHTASICHVHIISMDIIFGFAFTSTCYKRTQLFSGTGNYSRAGE